jgi:hypothetical protein
MMNPPPPANQSHPKGRYPSALILTTRLKTMIPYETKAHSPPTGRSNMAANHEPSQKTNPCVQTQFHNIQNHK